MINKCGECGGKVELVKKLRLESYKTRPLIVECELPACRSCDEVYLDTEYAKKLDEAIAVEYLRVQELR